MPGHKVIIEQVREKSSARTDSPPSGHASASAERSTGVARLTVCSPCAFQPSPAPNGHGNAAPRDPNRGTGRQGVGCAGRHRGRPALQAARGV